MSCNDSPFGIVLDPVFAGDTWGGLTVAMDSTGTEFAANLSSVRMQWRDDDNTAQLTLTSADNEITITDAASWEITVEPVVLTLAAGYYSWAIETTDADGTIKTRLGGTHQIKSDPVA